MRWPWCSYCHRRIKAKLYLETVPLLWGPGDLYQHYHARCFYARWKGSKEMADTTTQYIGASECFICGDRHPGKTILATVVPDNGTYGTVRYGTMKPYHLACLTNWCKHAGALEILLLRETT
jgi:hypothetical protein